MPLSSNDRKPVSSPSNVSSRLQSYMNSQPSPQQPSSSSSSLFESNLGNDPAIVYQQQLHRSMSQTNQQQQHPNSISYDENPRSFRQLPSQSTSANNSSFFPSNASGPQQNDILSRLSQAMQSHGKQNDDQRRHDQQRRDIEIDRLKSFQQAEQIRLKREEEELRKKQEILTNRQINFDQLTKTIDPKNQSTMEIDPFLAFQQSLHYQKEQQAKIEAQKYFISNYISHFFFFCFSERKMFVDINNNIENKLHNNPCIHYQKQSIGIDIHHKPMTNHNQ
jgi:hypothetical protein